MYLNWSSRDKRTECRIDFQRLPFDISLLSLYLHRMLMNYFFLQSYLPGNQTNLLLSINRQKKKKWTLFRVCTDMLRRNRRDKWMLY